MERRIAEEDNPLRRLELLQNRIDVERVLADIEDEPDIEALEEEFEQVVASYSDRKGITYGAWREFGVPAKVLREGGLSRSRDR